jgi:hemerythrin-like domain-containing protein
MSTDAIVLLKTDHKDIREQFRRFQQAGENAAAAKGRIVEKIIELLTVHTYIENEVMYPEVRRLLPDLEDDVLESYEEHHVADLLVAELAAMTPDAERFDAKTTVLIENVSHHMDEEEQDWFPKVREGLGRKQLQDLGERMIELKKTAPTSPAQPSALKKAIDAVISRQLSPPRAPDSRHPIHVDHTHPSVEPVPRHQAASNSGSAWGVP